MRKQNVVPKRRFTRREYSTAHFWNTLRARKGGDMGKPGRQANFELLRIIAMFMVVILHWNTNSGLLLMSEAL